MHLLDRNHIERIHISHAFHGGFGAMVGHGGIVAFDERTSIADIVRHVAEFAAAVRSRLERLAGQVQDAVAGQCRCRVCHSDVEVRDVSIVLEDVIHRELEALAENPFDVVEAKRRRRGR